MPLLDTSIVQISEEQMNDLFNEVPDKTPTANDLAGSKKEDKKDEKKEEEKKEPVDNQQFGNDNDIVALDVDDLPSDEDDETKKEDKKEEKKDEKKVEDKKEDKKEEKKAAPSEVSSILKSTVDYLVEKGIWKDFDGREDLEVTEELYAELAAKQDEERLKESFDELLDKTGPYGKAIIEYVNQGGNPDEIIDLFKEQKQVQSIDIKSEAGKKQLIEKYYEDVIGWKKEKINNYINTLVSSNKLDDESKEVKELFDAHYEEQLEQINAQQAQYVEQQKVREQQFEKNINDSLSARKDLTDREKKSIKDSILKYDKKLPDGSLVNDFYLKFAEIQGDPSKYIDLVMYVMDNDNYKKKIQKQADTKAAEKTFSFVKGNAALSNKKGSAHEKPVRQEEAVEFNWSIK